MRTIGCVLALLLVSAPSLAAPFEGSALLVGHSMKQTVSDRTVEIGLNLEFAPLNVVLASQRDQALKTAVSKVCSKSPDPTCKQSSQAYVNQALDALARMSDGDFLDVQSVAADPVALDQALREAGITDASTRASVLKLANSLPAGERDETLGLARELGNSDAVNLLFEPYVMLNFRPVALTLSIPFTLAVLRSSTSFSLGNVNIDAKGGTVWDLGGVWVGVTGGLGLYLPTGTRDVSASALANFLLAPKYTPQYLSFAPYAVVGLDFGFVQWQGSLELMSQHGVRNDPAENAIQYLRYGTGIVFLPTFVVSVIAELNGLAPIYHADIYKALFFAGGLRLQAGPVKASAAVQLPVYRKYTTLGTFGGVDFGELSGFSVLGRVAVGF